MGRGEMLPRNLRGRSARGHAFAAKSWFRGLNLSCLACGVVLIRHVIEQSELKTREKLLEVEYRLAELTETVKAGKPS